MPAVPGLAAGAVWVHYAIPSASMLPTLMVGDHVLAVQRIYRARRAAARRSRHVPLAARPGGAVSSSASIGLPGDRVQMKAGNLILNGEPVAIERTADFDAPGPGCGAGRYPAFIETLPGGRRYRTMRGCGPPQFENTETFTVPPGHYFMLGDNRDDSEDSRDPNGGVGFVPAANLVARAVFVTFSLRAPAQWWNVPGWPAALRWSRTVLLLE